MPELLRDKVVVITGASAGIGEATAMELAGGGAAVVLAARRQDRLDALAGRITGAGGRALAVATDVASEPDVRALIDRTIAEYGRLDVLICNAGFGVKGTLEEHSHEMMRRLLDVNFMGTFFAARAALPIFRQAGRGHLIFVSSIVGRRGAPFLGGYAATKFAQVGLAEALRAELAGSGIHVSVICPVATDTEFSAVMQQHSPGRKIGWVGPQQSAEQVARAIAACVRHPRPEVYPYRKSRMLPFITWLAPAFSDRLMQRFGQSPGAPAPHAD
ncbi:MAG TPA: SDR family NAD(P)-dependent oxidoreductase [Vicinamibacterales bacterium]|nr:SDR family NAD(P)-dependent oxidoreductase [Vicinamibacterales bacterium]